MGIAADPQFARAEPKKRERDGWFEEVLRAGRQAKQVGETVREAHQPGHEAEGGARGARRCKALTKHSPAP